LNYGYHNPDEFQEKQCLEWKTANLPFRSQVRMFTPLTPNDPYSDRTAPLTSKVAFYIFIQQIHVLNILNMVYTLRFFLYKMQFVS